MSAIHEQVQTLGIMNNFLFVHICKKYSLALLRVDRICNGGDGKIIVSAIIRFLIYYNHSKYSMHICLFLCVLYQHGMCDDTYLT